MWHPGSSPSPADCHPKQELGSELWSVGTSFGGLVTLGPGVMGTSFDGLGALGAVVMGTSFDGLGALGAGVMGTFSDGLGALGAVVMLAISGPGLMETSLLGLFLFLRLGLHGCLQDLLCLRRWDLRGKETSLP